MRTVEKKVFEAAMLAHSGEVVTDFTGICEPPALCYYDKATMDMIGIVIVNTAMVGHPAYHGEQDEYKIKDSDGIVADVTEVAAKAPVSSLPARPYDPAKIRIQWGDTEEVSGFGTGDFIVIEKRPKHNADE